MSNILIRLATPADALDMARGLDKTAMIVWVLDENVKAIKFYEQCGFIKDGKVMNSEYGKINGRIRMRKDLQTS